MNPELLVRDSLVRLLLTTICWLHHGSLLSAHEIPVRLKMEPLSLRTRSAAPIGMQVKLEYNETNILEGALILKVFDTPRSNNILLTTLRFEGIVLQGSDSIFNILLPPLPQTGSRGYDVEAWFETGNQTVALSASAKHKDPPDTFAIIGNTMGVRGLVLCSASGGTEPSRFSTRRSRLHDVLSTKSLVPQEYVSNLLYFPAPRVASSMPENPLELCCYDAVLLTEGALKQQDTVQLEAIAKWTEAGGSLCVAPTEGGHARRHLEFLRRLMPRHANRMRLSEDGRIEFPDDPAPYCADYAELGRCVLISSAFDETTGLSSTERDGLSAFFWKACGSSLPQPGHRFLARLPIWKQRRAEPQQRARGSGNLVINEWSKTEWGYADGFMDPGESEFGQMWHSALMPSDVRMVPTSVIAGLLLAFVVAVGPADYWLLGLLRRRKYTWIVFPLVTLAFTMAMVSVAHHYLGSNATGGRVVVTDIGSSGRVIRETVLQQSFLETRRDMSTEITTGLVASMQHRPLILKGRFPQKYSADRRVEQWTPEMLRTLSLSPAAKQQLPIDWDNFDLIATEAGRNHLRDTLRGDDSIECLCAAVLHGSSWITVHDERKSEHPTKGSPEYVVQETLRGALLHSIDVGTCVKPHGFFQYVSQVSPSGNAELEDIPIQDESNLDQWVLVILLRTDEGYQMFRRLYHVTEHDTQSEPQQSISNLQLHHVGE